MIAIQKLDMNDIISICRLIGLEEINSFMKENHISSRMVTGKTMLGYSQKGSAPFPMAFAVMYDLSRTDKRVIAFFEAKLSDIINEIEKSVKENFESVPKSFFTLTTEINSRFKGNEALFCKIVETASTTDYLSRIKMSMDTASDDDNMHKVNTGIKIIKDNVYPISNMEHDDFENLVGVLGIETARKIVPGMWIKGSDTTQICDYLYKNKYNDKIRNFLIKATYELLLAMFEKYTIYSERYTNEIKAAIQTLYESPFKTYLDFYIKITGQHFSKNYTNTLKETLLLPFINFNANESEKSEEIAELNKRIQNLDDVIHLRNAESERRYSEYEAKIAELEESKKNADDAMIAKDAEMAQLMKANKEYEEKAAASNNTTMLLSEKEALISEIKQLEDKKASLSGDVKQIEATHAQLTEKKIQLQNKLDDEIKRFSNDFVHSTAITALLQEVNRNSSGGTIFIELPVFSKTNITNENELLPVTEILADNLFSAGIQKYNDVLAKMILSTVLCDGSFIVYGSEQSNIADAISLALYAEYSAHVVLPMDISNIPYYIERINKIQRKVVYIDNALDTFTDRLCSALLKYCKNKTFVFSANDYDSPKRLKGSPIFEKCLYLNTERFSDFLIRPDYKANSCNLTTYQEQTDVYNSIIKKEYVTQLFKLFAIPSSLSRLWVRITAVYCNIYNTPFRKSIIMELIMTFMIKDALCNGSYEKIHDYINENEDAKLDLLDEIVAEDRSDESDN